MAKHSWLTLQEIMAFDWDKEIKRFCYIKNPYSFNESGLADPASLVQLRKEDKVIFAQNVKSQEYKKTEFISTYKEAVGEGFLTGLIEQLSSYGTPENVRIVFCFDS